LILGIACNARNLLWCDQALLLLPGLRQHAERIPGTTSATACSRSTSLSRLSLEDPEMLTRNIRVFGRTAAIASLTALAVGALTPSANAGPRHWHGGGAAAGAAIAAGAIGTGLAIAAARDSYAYDPGYDDEAPVAYYGGPTPYGYYRSGNYPYQVYGGDSPNSYCAQGTTWNCR
jgi:hypothetical protein